MTEFPVSGLRSVAIGLPDPAASARFYVEIWGLQQTAEADGVIYLRGTGDDHHLLALAPRETPAMLSMTFRAANRAALSAIADRVGPGGGGLLHDVSAMRDPAGGEGIAFLDHVGRAIRIVHDDRKLPELAQAGARPTRLAHVNINSRDVDATQHFFEQVLGFRLSDRSKLMSFVRTNSDHHAIVIAEAPLDGLNHIAFMQPSWEDVMRASGRMVDAGHPIGWGVGRHGPGDNVFAYFIGPAGFVIEHTAEVLVVDDSTPVHGPDHWRWPPGRTDQWGIAPPKPDHVKQAQLALRFATPDRVASGHEG